MPTLPVNNFTDIEFAKGARTPRPLPPAGRLYDGREHQTDSALFTAQQQSTVITLGTSIAIDDVLTLVVQPLTSMTGPAWASSLAPITVTYTSTDTSLTTAAAGLAAALQAAQTVSSLADLANYQRVDDIVQASSSGAALTLLATDAGATFSYTLSASGATTESSVTANAQPLEILVGMVGVSAGTQPTGRKTIAAPTAASTSSQIHGVVMDGMGKAPTTPGELFWKYTDGSDVPFEKYGPPMAWAEGPVTVDGLVYVRKVAGVGQYAGAVAGSATVSAVEIITVTPTPSNNELFRLDIAVVNLITGETVGSGYIEMTSDGDAIASEIVTGLKTSLDGAQASVIAPFIVDTGTDTLILTQASGYSLTISTANSVGVLGVAVTQAAVVEHMLYPGATFLQTTAAAGPAPIDVPR